MLRGAAVGGGLLRLEPVERRPGPGLVWGGAVRIHPGGADPALSLIHISSGTEPLIRVMIEGKDMERMEKAAKELAAFIEKTLQ